MDNPTFSGHDEVSMPTKYFPTQELICFYLGILCIKEISRDGERSVRPTLVNIPIGTVINNDADEEVGC